MSAGEPFGGALWLRPGHARPGNLRSSRPDWVERLTRDLPASRLPVALGRLFSLCGEAHMACARLALGAALGREEPVPAAVRAQLARQTLREHLRRIWLDWPRRLAETPPCEAQGEAAARVLARCPVFTSPTAGADTWLQAQAIGMPLGEWLSAWEFDPAGWLLAWCQRSESLPARLLRDCRPAADLALPAVAPLKVHAHAQGLREWAPGLHDAALARQPRWRGACAETGVWTRLNDSAPRPLGTPWLRLGARLAETVRLALPAGAPDRPARCATAWLSLGALPLAPGEAVAWVEMARGLLVHHLRVEGAGDAARVRACRVVAPTEWNFHPHGAVAQALESLPREHTRQRQRRLDALMAAYDPCVPFDQERSVPAEVHHA